MAFATGTEDVQWLELLDYGYVQHPDHYVSGNRTEIIDNDETVHFNLPYGMTINFIDMIIYASNSVSDNITAGLDAWGYNYLNTEKISNNLWRVYGSIPEHTYEKVEICLTSSSTSGYVNFYSCRVKFVTGSVVTVGDISIVGPGVYVNWDGYYEDVQFSDALWLQQFDFQLVFRDWRRYDTITLAIRTRVDQLSSMYTALADQTTVPSTYTMIENAPENGYYMFLVTIDLSDVDRTSSDAMYLFITGKGMDDATNQMEFLWCNGTVNIRYPDPVLFWFQELAKIQRDVLAKIDSIGSAVMNITDILENGFYPILEDMRSNVQGIYDSLVTILDHLGNIPTVIATWSDKIIGAINDFYTSVGIWFDELEKAIVHWGQNIVDVLTPDSSASDEVVDDMASQATEMDELNQGLDAMEKPDVDNIDTDISDIVSDGDITIVAGALSVVFSDGIIGSMFVLSLLFMLASYVLFGRR